MAGSCVTRSRRYHMTVCSGGVFDRALRPFTMVIRALARRASMPGADRRTLLAVKCSPAFLTCVCTRRQCAFIVSLTRSALEQRDQFVRSRPTRQQRDQFVRSRSALEQRVWFVRSRSALEQRVWFVRSRSALEQRVWFVRSRSALEQRGRLTRSRTTRQQRDRFVRSRSALEQRQ